MSTIPNVRDLLEGHITLSLESIDRLYLNGYLPQLQHGAGLVQFLCQHRGQPIASPALLGQITGKFVAEVKSFATQQAIPLFHFERKESKDLRAHQMRRERSVRDAGSSLVSLRKKPTPSALIVYPVNGPSLNLRATNQSCPTTTISI